MSSEGQPRPSSPTTTSAPPTSSNTSSAGGQPSGSGGPPSNGVNAARPKTLGSMPTTSPISIFSAATDTDTSSPSGFSGSALSPEAVDRVFPVRSVVSVDPTATPVPRRETGDDHPGVALPIGSNPRITRSRQHSLATESSPSRHSRHVSIDRPPSRRHSPSTRPQSTTSDKLPGIASADPVPADQPPGTAHNDINDLMRWDSRSERASLADRRVSMSSKAGSVRSVPEDVHFTARFKHVVTDGGHAVVTGRDGDTLQRCEDEPIHIPGAVQGFGLLIALREEAGKFVVRVASENSASIIGYSPEQLFRLSSFLDILTEEQADNLLDHLDFIRDESAADPAANGPEVFMLSLRAPGRRTQKFWCATHINEANQDLIICEFELEDDLQNPLVPPGERTPEPPEDTLGSNPTPEEFAESTVNVSKPLRVLRNARKKKGEAAAMEVFNIMAQVQEQLANAQTLAKFLKILIGVVKELTGFHRVMIYQFDSTFNGRVVSELVDPRATKDLYMGLNFPASDIPKQARELYRINKVRLLYDRDQETARLVCRTVEDLENPLDMTFAYLRAMSPVHLKYLGNMAVRSSMSISINAFDELWGLIACHSYGQRGMRVSFPIRKMCRLVGDTASRNIERLSYASRLQARKLINTTHTTANPSGYIVASSEDLLELFAADCGALSIRDETKILGKAEGYLQEILALLEFLRLRKIGSVFTSTDLTTDFPDLRYPPGFQSIAGLLFVPLSSTGNDFIAFFRKSCVKEVKWAGNPYEKFIKEGTEGYLEPRKSFRTWSEIVIGKCRDWTEQEIETAAVLCLVYGKFIEVWRQKEAALQSTQLQRLLLSNSAHEVRTPLNAIINYLEIALEGNLDPDTRESITKSHSASKSLVYVINDLLDLTKTEEGLELVKEEAFDFHVMLQEATDPFEGDAQRKSLDYQVNKLDGIPQFLLGDPRRVRQILSNVIANAIQNTTSGFVKVEVGKAQEQPSPGKIDIEFAVEDSGAGMPQQKVDALFRELEQVSCEGEDMPSMLMEKSSPRKSPTTPSIAATTLGLGLAVVARAIRNMRGQLRLKTEEGKGSRFIVQLVFGLQNQLEGDGQHESSARDTVEPVPANEGKVSSAPTLGDGVTLVNRSSKKRTPTLSLSRSGSQESVHSMKSKSSLQSMRSGNSVRSAKSDVDRLIDDIQKPHLLSDPQTPDVNRRRESSSSKLLRSASAGESPTRRSRVGKSLFGKTPGEEKVTDSCAPLKAVRLSVGGGVGGVSAAVGDAVGAADVAGHPPSQTGFKCNSKVAFELPQWRRPPPASVDAERLSVLVAEDDPVNSKIMKKRLEKLGHSVHLTVNGEECSSALGDQPSFFDVVLMDIQMPIVDGFTSTKIIRSLEKTNGQGCLSPRANVNGRIPIFAVSASLVERDREKYIKTGFDGWILKPVNFQRVDNLLKGIVADDVRNACLFETGKWEQGGWFEKRQVSVDVFSTDTTPSGGPPTMESPKPPASLSKADTR